jgi:hypothetical protein
MKKYSTSLAIKEMQIKTTLGFHLTPKQMLARTGARCVRGKSPYTLLVGM